MHDHTNIIICVTIRAALYSTFLSIIIKWFIWIPMIHMNTIALTCQRGIHSHDLARIVATAIVFKCTDKRREGGNCMWHSFGWHYAYLGYMHIPVLGVLKWYISECVMGLYQTNHSGGGWNTSWNQDCMSVAKTRFSSMGICMQTSGRGAGGGMMGFEFGLVLGEHGYCTSCLISFKLCMMRLDRWLSISMHWR